MKKTKLNITQVLEISKHQGLFQMRGKKMDQRTFLSEALWQFSEASAFTDLILVCKDGEVAVHSPIIAKVFVKFGFSANLQRHERLLLPDNRCPKS